MSIELKLRLLSVGFTLLRILIGSSHCFGLLWLAEVIRLVLVLRQSVENCSIISYYCYFRPDQKVRVSLLIRERNVALASSNVPFASASGWAETAGPIQDNSVSSVTSTCIHTNRDRWISLTDSTSRIRPKNIHRTSARSARAWVTIVAEHNRVKTHNPLLYNRAYIIETLTKIRLILNKWKQFVICNSLFLRHSVIGCQCSTSEKVDTSCLFLLWFLIGSLCCLRSLWFTRVAFTSRLKKLLESKPNTTNSYFFYCFQKHWYCSGLHPFYEEREKID